MVLQIAQILMVSFLAPMSEGLKILSEWDWCRNQPPLFAGQGYLPSATWNRWWSAAHYIPHSLEQSTKRLGHHYEDLIFHAINQNPELGVQRNLQIIEDKRTLGEVDFLIDEGGRRCHLEVSIKFYLHCPIRNELISPSGKENWNQKREKLFIHQIPLGKQYYSDIDQSMVWVQGMVGYHPKAKPETLDIPNLTHNHPKGHWVYASEFFEVIEELGDAFMTGGLLGQHHRDRWGVMPAERKIDFSALAQIILEVQKGERPYAWLVEEKSREVWVVVNEDW